MSTEQTSLSELLKNQDTLLALESEELAGLVLKDLIRSEQSSNKGRLHIHNYNNSFQGYGEDVQQAIMEAWIWLEQEGCIAPRPGLTSRDWIYVTQRGKRLAESQDTSAYKRANLLPRQLLHPVIAQRVWAAFIRGDYDVAVFQAFKEVEIGVRQAGSFNPEDIGVSLMRKAFHPDTGPLRDQDALQAERQALSDLFAGAIGSYKNPHSHRNVAVNDPDEAIEMIVLASHLLKIVDYRSSHQSKKTQK